MILICIVLAVLIGIIGMTTFSFSWFEPDVKEGVGLQFSDSVNLRPEKCTFSTYSGTKGSNGVITYSETALVKASSLTLSGTETSPSIAYYKTVITNENANKDTVVSLYLKSFNVTTQGSASLGVAIPTNSYRTYTTEEKDLHIIRNAHVSYLVQNEDRTGELVVEWFVKCDSGSVTFNPGDLYIMYS